MNYEAANEPSGFIFDNAYISRAEKAGGDLIWHTESPVLRKDDSRNSTGRDMYIRSAEVIFRRFSLKSAAAAERKYLDSDGKSPRITAAHTLYKSEHPAFTERLFSESADIFSLECAKQEQGFLIKARLCFEADLSIYDAEFFCSDIIISWDELTVPLNKGKQTLRDRADRLKLDIPAVFLALSHKDTPRLAKVMSAIAMGYALSPLDLIPDFIPVLGYLDDVLILPGLLFMAIKLIPDEVMDECRKKSKDIWDKGIPKKWVYAMPVIIIWIIILIIIISLTLNN